MCVCSGRPSLPSPFPSSPVAPSSGRLFLRLSDGAAPHHARRCAHVPTPGPAPTPLLSIAAPRPSPQTPSPALAEGDTPSPRAQDTTAPTLAEMPEEGVEDDDLPVGENADPSGAAGAWPARGGVLAFVAGAVGAAALLLFWVYVPPARANQKAGDSCAEAFWMSLREGAGRRWSGRGRRRSGLDLSLAKTKRGREMFVSLHGAVVHGGSHSFSAVLLVISWFVVYGTAFLSMPICARVAAPEEWKREEIRLEGFWAARILRAQGWIGFRTAPFLPGWLGYRPCSCVFLANVNDGWSDRSRRRFWVRTLGREPGLPCLRAGASRLCRLSKRCSCQMALCVGFSATGRDCFGEVLTQPWQKNACLTGARFFAVRDPNWVDPFLRGGGYDSRWLWW